MVAFVFHLIHFKIAIVRVGFDFVIKFVSNFLGLFEREWVSIAIIKL